MITIGHEAPVLGSRSLGHEVPELPASRGFIPTPEPSPVPVLDDVGVFATDGESIIRGPIVHDDDAVTEVMEIPEGCPEVAVWRRFVPAQHRADDLGKGRH